MSNGKGPIRRSPNLNLQEARSRRGWTQQEVADRVGTTVVNVSRWERGVTAPSPYYRQQLCVVFEKDAGALGLVVPVKETSQPETEPTSEDVPLDISETVLVNPAPPSAFLSLRQRFLGPRRMLWMIISVVLVILVIGSSVLIVNRRSDHPVVAKPLRPLVPKVIAKDTFQRADQTYWGTNSDRQPWMDDASTLSNFSIVNKTAHIDAIEGFARNAIIGPRVSDAEVIAALSMSSFSDSNLGVVLRWNDATHWYKAYITGTTLVVEKKNTDESSDNASGIVETLFKAEDDVLYMIRFRAIGKHLSAKVWRAGEIEPKQWMLEADDDTFSSGFCGVRGQVHGGATATITSFEATQFS